MGRRPGDAEGQRRRGVKGGNPETRLVAAGRRKEWTQGIVNPAVWRASTILFDSVAAMKAANPPEQGVLHYGRNGTPTIWALCEALTEMEPGAAMTCLYPSGSAAVAGALLAVLQAGDELLMVDSVYGPTRALCDGLLKRFGVSTVYYDPMIGAGIEALVGEKTRAIFMESPGTHSFEVQDVPGICAVAKAKGVVTLLDNTWATPLFFQAMAAGVDLSILACTKYIGGHADLMLGSVTATAALADRLEKARRLLGQIAGPDDAWLALRGLRTLDVRMKRHQESGLEVARWLKAQPQVARVLHPALEDCPGHEYWARDFTGATGLFSFALEGGDDAARTRLVDSLERFGIGYSWGAFESLALPADPVRTASKADFGGLLVRLHIGLEDPKDLIEDLAAGLARCGTQA
jgi:cysteine-S-conjugate beta-lyase